MWNAGWHHLVLSYLTRRLVSLARSVVFSPNWSLTQKKNKRLIGPHRHRGVSEIKSLPKRLSWVIRPCSLPISKIKHLLLSSFQTADVFSSAQCFFLRSCGPSIRCSPFLYPGRRRLPIFPSNSMPWTVKWLVFFSACRCFALSAE